jgi:hypothetical protein
MFRRRLLAEDSTFCERAGFDGGFMLSRIIDDRVLERDAERLAVIAEGRL